MMSQPPLTVCAGQGNCMHDILSELCDVQHDGLHVVYGDSTTLWMACQMMQKGMSFSVVVR